MYGEKNGNKCDNRRFTGARFVRSQCHQWQVIPYTQHCAAQFNLNVSAESGARVRYIIRKLQATDVFSEFLMRYANVVSDDASF